MTIDQIRQDIRDITNTDTNSYSDAKLIANVNRHYENVLNLILQYDYNWIFDDSNYTDFPIGTTTLVNGQQDYNIVSSTFLKILRVEVLDNNGKYQLIEPFDENNIQQSLTEYSGTNGLPKTYQKLGDSILLYPTPATGSVTLAAGLKVYYQRVPSYFLTSDTTKTPGFNPLYHRILSYGASLDYCIWNDMNNKINTLTPQLQALQDQLCIAYTRRPAESKPKMSPYIADTR